MFDTKVILALALLLGSAMGSLQKLRISRNAGRWNSASSTQLVRETFSKTI